MGYLMTLMVILIMTNIMLYIYGVDMPIAEWMNCSGNSSANNDCWGAQTIGTGTSTGPTGNAAGGLGSVNLIYQLILVIVAAVLGTVVVNIIAGAVSTNFTVSFTIPMAMFLAILATLIISPMGTLIVSSPDPTTGLYCYNMRADSMSFGDFRPACLYPEVHILMILFFGLLTIGAFLSFVAGRDV